MFEKGQWNAIQNKYAAQEQVCPDMSGSPIEFPNCISAFIILISGAILALLLFGIEFCVKPFDHTLDPIRKYLGDHADFGRNDYDPIKIMDREELELTINKQRDAIQQITMELAMYQKSCGNIKGSEI